MTGFGHYHHPCPLAVHQAESYPNSNFEKYEIQNHKALSSLHLLLLCGMQLNAHATAHCPPHPSQLTYSAIKYQHTSRRVLFSFSSGNDGKPESQ